MRLNKAVALAAVLSFMAAVPAQATIIGFSASLNGAQENPPVPTPATGTGTFSYDDVTNVLSYNITYSGLLANETAAHFHRGAVGMNGGIQIGLPSPGQPKIGTVNLTAVHEADLLAGLWYCNIHTTLYPAGEIRGQLERAVPAQPSSWGRIKGLYK